MIPSLHKLNKQSNTLVFLAGAVPEGPLVPFVDLGGGPMAVSLEALAPNCLRLQGFPHLALGIFETNSSHEN